MFDPTAVLSQLNELPTGHRIAFAASCCERQLPNYQAFSLAEGWGDVTVLRHGLDEAWRLAQGCRPDIDALQELIHACENEVPDLDYFVLGFFASLAMFASASVVDTLQY